MARLLIVDDNEQNLYMLKILLEGHGYQVDLAENGAKALEAARLSRPDMIVADILMPVMDGFTLCREWRKDESLKNIPFLFYTATYTTPKDEAFALSLGADRFIVKPVEIDILMKEIKEVLAAYERGETAKPVEIIDSDSDHLRNYNETLIRKLEDKMAQLEAANKSLLHEVNERRQTEAMLKRLSTAIDHTADGIIITDAEGVIEYVNPGYEMMTGFLWQEVIGRNLNSFEVRTREEEQIHEEMWRRINSGNSWSGRLIGYKKDGCAIEQEAVVSPIFDFTGKINGFVFVNRDVTEQVKLKAQLVHSQKMEALGTLAGGVAHDFNNVLGVIAGYTDLALMENPDDGPIQFRLNQVLTACDRARSLVQQILTFSRKAKMDRVPVNLAPIAQECLKFMRATLPTGIEIESDIGNEVGLIRADPTQLHQIIMNLTTNAAAAMKEQTGILGVNLKMVEIEEQTAGQYENLAPGLYQLLAVSDTGIGMDKETADRIFEPFFTTKEPGQGTGLGLAVVHGLVKSYGGAIIVHSEPGQGSTFNVFLPVDLPAEADGPQAEPVELPKGGERILFVDDEEDLAHVGSQMLEYLGYHVTTLTSSREALNLFKENPESYDLVITDQSMPHMAGTDMAREMINIRPRVPIILCTGYSVQSSLTKAKSIGIERCITKPLFIREMASVIRDVLDGAG